MTLLKHLACLICVLSADTTSDLHALEPTDAWDRIGLVYSDGKQRYFIRQNDQIVIEAEVQKAGEETYVTCRRTLRTVFTFEGHGWRHTAVGWSLVWHYTYKWDDVERLRQIWPLEAGRTSTHKLEVYRHITQNQSDGTQVASSASAQLINRSDITVSVNEKRTIEALSGHHSTIPINIVVTDLMDRRTEGTEYYSQKLGLLLQENLIEQIDYLNTKKTQWIAVSITHNIPSAVDICLENYS